MNQTEERLNLEILKLLIQVAWADHEIAADERAMLEDRARATGLGEQAVATLHRFLATEAKLPAPDFGFLRLHRDAAIAAAEKMVHSDDSVSDSEEEVLAEIRHDKFNVISIDDIPAILQSAIISVEDKRFYYHSGVDPEGIGRAIIKNIAKGRIAEGGSTLTQQLVKNLTKKSERTITRKINEGFAALEMEENLTKKQILELYLNSIYFGSGAWGIEAAAKEYFGKEVSDLNIQECAALAAIPKSPGKYNPFSGPEASKKRRNLILDMMVEEKQLSKESAEKAKSAELELRKPVKRLAPYFIDYIKQKMVEVSGKEILSRDGIKVYTSLNKKMQLEAEKVFKQEMAVFASGSELQGAFIAVDAYSGGIKVMIGGKDYRKSRFNRALYAFRQPGSTFKPFIYATALQQGMDPLDMISDEPVVFKWGKESWQPKNYGSYYLGNITLLSALSNSSNVSAVKILDQVKVKNVKKITDELGFDHDAEENLTLALGTSESSLLTLTNAYDIFVNEGIHTPPYSIEKITDWQGNVLYERTPESAQVISRQTAYKCNIMLQSVVGNGTAQRIRSLGFNRPCGGKTGTTSNYTDAWFVGFTPELVAGVWLGFDMPRSMGYGFTGGGSAAPIWAKVMQQVTAGTSSGSFKIAESGLPEDLPDQSE